MDQILKDYHRGMTANERLALKMVNDARDTMPSGIWYAWDTRDLNQWHNDMYKAFVKTLGKV